MSTPAPRLPVDPGYLRDLFSRHARTYDPVNTLISLGAVHLWRRRLVRLTGLNPGERVLDAFSGPGSLGSLAARHVGPRGEVVFADLSPAMLALARQAFRSQCGRHSALARCPHVRFLAQDVLGWRPAADFDAVFLGFALRYTDDPAAALRHAAGLLKPGGRLAVLEFTRAGETHAPWARLPRWYFHQVLPAIAGRLGRGREIYDYLSASSAAFLTPVELETAAVDAGLVPRHRRESMGGLVCQLVAVKV